MFSESLEFVARRGSVLIDGADMTDMTNACSAQYSDHTLRQTADQCAPALLVALNLGTLCVAGGRWGIGVHIRGETLGNYYMIYCLNNGQAKITQDRRSLVVRKGEIGLFSPWPLTEIEASPQVEATTVQVPWDYINEIWQVLGGVPAMRPLMFEMRVEPGGVLYTLIARYLNELSSLDEGILIPRVRAHFDSTFSERVAVAMLLHQSHNGQMFLKSSREIRDKRILRRALEEMDDHLDMPLGVFELSRICGAPYHAVLSAFIHYTGEGPKKWLTTRRLHKARMLLRDPVEATITVKDIARSFGFLTAGNFSKIYFEEFGESPSQTLRRGIDRNFYTQADRLRILGASDDVEKSTSRAVCLDLSQ